MAAWEQEEEDWEAAAPPSDVEEEEGGEGLGGSGARSSFGKSPGGDLRGVGGFGGGGNKAAGPPTFCELGGGG